MDVSVLVLTYNHSKYIRQALDSVLAQETNLRFEILVCDDASSDSTQDIIREYKSTNPQKVRFFFRKRNGNFPTQNAYYLLSKAKGKYLAFLEGDDYWIDVCKLQMQYDFLEKHPEYSACAGENICVDENGQHNGFDVPTKSANLNNVIRLDDYVRGGRAGHISTFFIRNYFDKEKYKILYRANNFVGDFTIEILCLLEGDIYSMPSSLSAWRFVKKSGKLNFNSINKSNIYNGYVCVCYFIRVENFIRENYDRHFTFDFIFDWMLTYCRDLPIKSYIKFAALALDKWRYIKYLFILVLLSGYYHSDITDKKGQYYDLGKFKKEKKRIIIFGAGDSAAEYLDQEGWRERPLFIIDNDINKQGKSFKGYIVKKPEDIIPIRDKVIVLIASKFHEQKIAAQLEEMGIKNLYFYCGMKSRQLRNRLANLLMDEKNEI